MTNETTSINYRYTIDYGMRDLWKSYLKKPFAKDIKQAFFTKVWKQYIDTMMKRVIKEGKVLSMQAMLGDIFISSKRIKFKFDEEGNLLRNSLRIDWKSTNELWARDSKAKEKKQLVYHFNEHSARLNYKFIWDKRRSRLKNQSLYMYKPSRAIKRALAAHILSEDFDTVYFLAK